MELEELLAMYEEIHRNAKKVEVVLPPVEVDKTFDDAPEDLINLDYADLINIYKKIQKVIEIKYKFQTYEVPEERVSIEPAEKPEAKETMVAMQPPKPPKPVLPEKPAELPPSPEPAKLPTQIREVEKREEVLKLPEEKFKKPEVLVFAKGEKMEEEEKKLEVAIPYIDSHEGIAIEMPKQLSVPVDEAAKKKIEEIVKRYQQAGEINKSDARRKMIELTRELFKEKSIDRKAELKAQIVELKKVIEQKEAGMKGEGIFDAVVKEQDEDLNNSISELLATFNTNFDKVNNEYQQAKMIIFEDSAMSAQVDSLFSSDLGSIFSQMTKIIDAYLDYIMKVHVAELENLRGFGGVNAEQINKRIEYVQLNYPKKFDELKNDIALIINKKKPSAVTSAKPSQPPAPPKATVEERTAAYPPRQVEKKEEREVLEEINTIHEGELLHYLSAHDRRMFVSYVRGEISKEEAVKQAKILLAKERGVSDTLIKTYLG